MCDEHLQQTEHVQLQLLEAVLVQGLVTTLSRLLAWQLQLPLLQAPTQAMQHHTHLRETCHAGKQHVTAEQHAPA
jgi:hypothetical protein